MSAALSLTHQISAKRDCVARINMLEVWGGRNQVLPYDSIIAGPYPVYFCIDPMRRNSLSEHIPCAESQE